MIRLKIATIKISGHRFIVFDNDYDNGFAEETKYIAMVTTQIKITTSGTTTCNDSDSANDIGYDYDSDNNDDETNNYCGKNKE